jgi:CheY-like chemotaxis protein
MTLANLGGARTAIENEAEAFFAALARERYDVVIVDAMMPETNGLACLERIAGSPLAHPDVVYFVLSAAAPDELGWKIPEGLTVGWLRKPFRPRELLDALRASLGG